MFLLELFPSSFVKANLTYYLLIYFKCLNLNLSVKSVKVVKKYFKYLLSVKNVALYTKRDVEV